MAVIYMQACIAVDYTAASVELRSLLHFCPLLCCILLPRDLNLAQSSTNITVFWARAVVVLYCPVLSLALCPVALAWVLVFNVVLSGGLCTLALLCCGVIPDAEPALTLTLVLFFGVMSSFICSSFSRLPPLGTSTPWAASTQWEVSVSLLWRSGSHQASRPSSSRMRVLHYLRRK